MSLRSARCQSSSRVAHAASVSCGCAGNDRARCRVRPQWGRVAEGRVERFTQWNIHMDWPGRPALGERDGLGHDALRVPDRVGVAIVLGQNETAAHVGLVKAGLVDGLVVLLVDPLGGAVGGEDEQRHLLVEGLDHGRAKIHRGGARRADEAHGGTHPLGHAQGDIACRTLVVDDADGGLGVICQGESQRGRPAAGCNDEVAHTQFDAGLYCELDEEVHSAAHGRGGVFKRSEVRQVRRARRAWSPPSARSPATRRPAGNLP